MSALTPANGKYRKTWQIFGLQCVDKEMVDKYRKGFDKIKWGDPDKFEVEELVLDNHTITKCKK